MQFLFLIFLDRSRDFSIDIHQLNFIKNTEIYGTSVSFTFWVEIKIMKEWASFCIIGFAEYNVF